MINGTGQISLSTQTRSNNTSEDSRTYAAGPMQVSEEIRMMDGSLILALVSTKAVVLNGIGLLVTWLKYKELERESLQFASEVIGALYIEEGDKPLPELISEVISLIGKI